MLPLPGGMLRAIRSKHVSALAEHRFFLLFLFLLATLILYPFAEEGRFSYFTLRVLGSAVILLSVYAAGFRHSLLLLALVLALPALLQRLLLPTTDRGWLPVASILLSFVFDIFIVVVFFRHVFCLPLSLSSPGVCAGAAGNSFSGDATAVEATGVGTGAAGAGGTSGANGLLRR